MSKSVDLQSLVESHTRPFVVIDRRHRVVAVNRAFQQIFGMDAREAVGQACYELINPTGRPCPCRTDGSACPFAAIFDGAKARSVDRVMTDLHGREQAVRVHAFPLQTESGETYLAELIETVASTARPTRPAPSSHDDAMVGNSKAFRDMVDQLDRAASSSVPVLLLGTTGTGKELAAHYVHAHSRRHARQMLTIDCTVLTEALFESEVFGHERGAFTGSVGERQGLFELADGGTLFLDEIGELSPVLQAKLLRVLESGEFRRVGGRKSLRANVRLICATNRELRASNGFRQDLYYRVSAATVRVPSLAERLDDVADLAVTLLEQIARDAQCHYRLTPAALRRLRNYPYPGNIRELRNILWSALTQCSDGVIDVEHVAAAMPCNGWHADPAPATTAYGPDDALAGRVDLDGIALHQLEAGHLARLLQVHGGNRRRVAVALGVSERTVYRKLKRHNLH